MAVSPIKSIGIIGLMSDLDKVIKLCGESGIFHPDDASNFYSDTKNFLPITERNPYSDLLAEMEDIFQLSSITPEFVSLKGFNANYSQLEEYTKFLSSELGALLAKRSCCEQKVEQCKREISETGHFLGVDLQLDKIAACKYIKTNFGRLPKESYDKLQKNNDNPYLVFFPCTDDDTHYWGMYISPIDQCEDIDRIFSSLFFEHYEISGLSGTPEKHYEKLREDLKQYEKDLERAALEVENFKEDQQKICMKYYTKISSMNTCFSIKKYVLKYHKSFILVGWVPSEAAERFVKSLESINSVECTLSDGKDELKHSPPVKLKNNFFSRPFEFFVDMYGIPCYDEIDPTIFVSVTFTILFGIMFGDVGQGLLLSVFGYFMWKLKKMAIGKILIPCGISSAIFGCVYGSVFGFETALDPVYRAIGFEEKPVDVMESATGLIVMAITIGVTLLITAMVLNIYSSFKRRDLESAIFGPSGISGLVFYVSLIFGLVGQLVLQINVLTPAYVIGLMLLPLLLILLREPLGKLVSGKKNWKPEKWGEYLVQNFFELFETLLSYVTNTMSFLRVGAFVLVHAGMMLVVFTVATVLQSLLGLPGYIVIVAAGNLGVMALEATLVCIQIMRLEYYELFSRFYIGSGRKFSPIRLDKK